jgi:hypothetical protein
MTMYYVIYKMFLYNELQMLYKMHFVTMSIQSKVLRLYRGGLKHFSVSVFPVLTSHGAVDELLDSRAMTCEAKGVSLVSNRRNS